MFLNLRLFTTIATVFLSLSAYSVNDNCALKIAEIGMLGGQLGYGKALDFEQFRPFQSILLLSDGINDTFGKSNEALNLAGAFSIGERLANQFPEKKILQTDFNIEGMSQKGNLTQQQLNNAAESWPEIEDGAYDLIILRKGMCTCCQHKPCGGFETKHAKSKRFFKNVIQKLNLENPKSMAILHGQELVSSKTVERWKRVAEELEQEFPIEITFARAPRGVGFEPNEHGIDAIPHVLKHSEESLESPIKGEFNSIFIKPLIGSDKETILNL